MNKTVRGPNHNRGKILLISLILSLIGLIFLLSIFDAPEYIRCTHIGVCEFLELSVNLSDSQRSVVIISAMSKTLKEALSITDSLVKPFYFPLWLKNHTYYHHLIYYLIKGRDSFDALCNLYRCISPSGKTFCSPLELSGKVLENVKHTSPSQESKLPSLTLQIVTTSIIKS